MIIREYANKDNDDLAEIHKAQGFDYKMLDLNNHQVVAKGICEHNNEVIGGYALVVQLETYLFIKPEIESAIKWEAIQLMQKEVIKQSIKLGLCYNIGCIYSARY